MTILSSDEYGILVTVKKNEHNQLVIDVHGPKTAKTPLINYNGDALYKVTFPPQYSVGAQFVAPVSSEQTYTITVGNQESGSTSGGAYPGGSSAGCPLYVMAGGGGGRSINAGQEQTFVIKADHADPKE